jgi:fatty-acyl-CoA synthase
MCRTAATDLLVGTAARQPGQTAIIFGDNRISYGQFNERVNRLAHGLMRLGIKKGNHAAIFSHNCDQFFIYWYAVMKIGAVMVPVNWLYQAEELKYIINHSESKLLIVEDTFADLVEAIRPELKTVEHYGYITYSGGRTPSDWFNIEALQTSKQPSLEPAVEISGDDTGLIIYTSGTESLPKGAMISHMAIFLTATVFQYNFNYHKEMIFLMGLPCFHGAGLFTFSAVVGLGGTIVVMYQPDPKDILMLTAREKVTHWSWVTTVYATLLQFPGLETYDLTSLEGANIFGSYVSPTLLSRWREIASKIVFTTGYGQTECLALSSNAGKAFEKKLDSVGQPTIFNLMEIQNADGETLPSGQAGEVVVRSPLIMKGYFKDEQKTADTFRGGWLHTGDIGKVDEDGYLYFVDRIKDMIKSGGENVASTDVEEAIASHPEVSEVAVIGLRHPIWQEAVTAVVTVRPGKSLTPDEIINHCKKKIAAYKVPKKVFIRESLPKSNVGKILKRELKEIYSDTFSE